MASGFTTVKTWESCVANSKTEDPKSNKGKLTFPPHTVNAIEL